MKLLLYILILHIALLMLASTNFTIVTFPREGTSLLTWEYLTFTRRGGFGFEYVSDYSLSQVLTYIAAYATGLVTFILVLHKGFRWISLPGLILSILGLLSFVIEGSHWLFDHHRSWIVSFPIAFVAIWIVLLILIPKGSKPDLSDETEQAGSVGPP